MLILNNVKYLFHQYHAVIICVITYLSLTAMQFKTNQQQLNTIVTVTDAKRTTIAQLTHSDFSYRQLYLFATDQLLFYTYQESEIPFL